MLKKIKLYDLSTLMPSKCVAFTLAEVLITLGIIGVVAAMTLPVLLQEYKKQVYVTQLKKTFSVVSQGFTKYMADEGITSLKDSPIVSDSILVADNTELDAMIKKYFKVVKSCTPNECDFSSWDASGGPGSFASVNTAMSGSAPHFYFLADGTILYFKYTLVNSGSDYQLKQPIWFDVDVNGTKGPNKMGRDVFILAINEFGNVEPWDDGGWKGNDSDSKKPCIEHDVGDGMKAWFCANQIVEDGWKMNY